MIGYIRQLKYILDKIMNPFGRQFIPTNVRKYLGMEAQRGDMAYAR